MTDARPPDRAARTTPALRALLGLRAAARAADRLYYALGYLSGLQLLLLAGFITYQATARKLGGPYVQGTDSISGYVLAMAVTWALAYSLRSGAHVRIDVLLPYMRPAVRAVADFLALLAVAFFAFVVAWKTWGSVIDDYERGVVATAYPAVPLYIPKAVIAAGFTLLVLTAAQMMLSSLAERWLPRAHAAMGGGEIAAAAGPEGAR